MRKTGMTSEVRECLAEMGVTDEVLAKVKSASNHTDGEKLLAEAKETCRKGFRAIAGRYHPDQNQHLPPNELKAKEERFKRLRSVHDSFLESRYRGPERSRTQMGADDFDPFGFYKRDSRLEAIIAELRNRRPPTTAEEFSGMSDADLRLLQILQQREHRRKVKFAEDLINRRPQPPKPKPPPNTAPVALPAGVWHRNEASCQPQTRPPRKPKTPR